MDEKTKAIAVIGGSGLSFLEDIKPLLNQFEISPFTSKLLSFQTIYADSPVEIGEFSFSDRVIYFVPRHGETHQYPPHLIPTKAQLWALKELGVTKILASNAVGGIEKKLNPGALVIPDQLIDYTWGRAHTFYDELNNLDNHIDFTLPYHDGLRQELMSVCNSLGFVFDNSGVYGCTQGPRLETAAEVARLARDGCTIVGMTGMPEASLSRELGLDYASLALVVNPAAGVSAQEIKIEDIKSSIKLGMEKVVKILFTCALKI